MKLQDLIYELEDIQYTEQTSPELLRNLIRDLARIAIVLARRIEELEEK
jgi:hypothetical protein